MNQKNTLIDYSLYKKIETALDKIRPYLIADGGNVKLLEVTKDMIVKLELTGNCENCKMSNLTMQAGVEQTLKQAIPEIKGVEAINSNH